MGGLNGLSDQHVSKWTPLSPVLHLHVVLHQTGGRNALPLPLLPPPTYTHANPPESFMHELSLPSISLLYSLTINTTSFKEWLVHLDLRWISPAEWTVVVLQDKQFVFLNMKGLRKGKKIQPNKEFLTELGSNMI